MADSIILLFVLVIIIFAVKGSIKHFKGEGGCCGGGSKGLIKAEKKTLTSEDGRKDRQDLRDAL